MRTGLADCLGIDHGRVRVIAPDVGGGFGYKGILAPEEVCVGWLAMKTRRPARWIEDRREHLIANANCREHAYEVTAYADAAGKLLALDAEATVDAGAYSAYPFTATASRRRMAGSKPAWALRLSKAYRVKHLVRWLTNKPPIDALSRRRPRRGVLRHRA